MAPSKRKRPAVHQCDECTTAFTNKRDLKRHCNEHAKKRQARASRFRFNCGYCFRKFASDGTLQDHINDFHFKQTDARYACKRCLRYKMPCCGVAPCKWCSSDGFLAECVILDPQTAAATAQAQAQAQAPAPAPTAAIPPQQQQQQQEQARGQQLSVELPALIGLAFVPAHAAAGWSTPRPNSPTDTILSLPPRPVPAPPPMETATKLIHLSLKPTGRGQVDIRIPSLSWLDFEVAYSPSQEARIRQLLGLPEEPAEDAPPDAPHTIGLEQELKSMWLLFKEPHLPEMRELLLAPGIGLLSHLLDVYFEKWQIVQPIIHVATWRFDECPMVLLGAMACVGAVFNESDDIVQQAHNISARCISDLDIMGCGRLEDVDNQQRVERPEDAYNQQRVERLEDAYIQQRVERPGDANNQQRVEPPEDLQRQALKDITYIAGVCLHQSYLLGSGDEQVHDQIHAVRSFLIDSLKRLRLLGAGMNTPDPFSQMLWERTHSLHSEWTAWVNREFAIRTTWAVIELDCNFSLLTGRPCEIDLKELPSRFPCSDEVYDARNAKSWDDRRQESPYRSLGPLVSTVVADTASKVALSDHISAWSKRLCTQVLERIFREYIRHAQQDGPGPAAGHRGGDLGSAAMDKTEGLLWSINFLGTSIHDRTISKPATEKDLIHFSATKLIRHYTHLTVCSGMMDLITYIARAAASDQSPGCCTSLRWAQKQLIEQLAVRPYKARQSLWHAGQMIRIAKIYEVLTPWDSLRIFTAYLMILAFAKYGPRSVRDVEGVEPLAIDGWPACKVEVEHWLQAGGPTLIGAEIGVYFGCETEGIIQESHRMLARLENWGISERFFNILVHFNDLDVDV
ncbi:hypothetical protein V8C35DRAFT_145858 [Trichoderma chlorosporum]